MLNTKRMAIAACILCTPIMTSIAHAIDLDSPIITPKPLPSPITPLPRPIPVTTLNTRIINGKIFPTSSTLKSTSTTGICDPYERRTKARAPLDVQTNGANKNWSPWFSAQFAALPGWTLTDFDLVVISAANVYQHEGPTFEAAGQHSLSGYTFEKIESNIKDYIGHFDFENSNSEAVKKFKLDLIAKLHSVVSSYESYARFVDQTHDTVSHRVRVRNNGLFHANVRSWWEGHINVEETCVPAEVTSETALESTLKSWAEKNISDFENSQPSNGEPIAHWSFENGRADDVTGNGNDGTFKGSGTKTATGVSGQAALVGSGKYVDIINTGQFNYLDSFTLSAWINPSQINSYNFILSKVTPNRDFSFQLTNTGQLNVHFAHSATYYSCTTPESIPLNRWTHVAATWQKVSSTTGYWKLYVNGAIKKSCVVSNAQPIWTGNNISIGSLQKGSYLFTGKIDEVKIFDDALNATEIRAEYGR